MVEVVFAISAYGFFLILAVFVNAWLNAAGGLAYALDISFQQAVDLINVVGVVLLVLLGIFLYLAFGRAWRGVTGVFRRRLPSRREEISLVRMKRANKKYLRKAVLFLSLTMIVETFAIQQWALIVGLFGEPVLSLSLSGLMFTGVLFYYAALFGAFALESE